MSAKQKTKIAYEKKVRENLLNLFYVRLQKYLCIDKKVVALKVLIWSKFSSSTNHYTVVSNHFIPSAHVKKYITSIESPAQKSFERCQWY